MLQSEQWVHGVHGSVMLGHVTGSTLLGSPGTSAAAAPASPGTSSPLRLPYACPAEKAGGANASGAPLLKLRPSACQPPLAQNAAATGLTPLLNSSGLPPGHAAAENCRPLVLAMPGASAQACSTARAHARSSMERFLPSIACGLNKLCLCSLPGICKIKVLKGFCCLPQSWRLCLVRSLQSLFLKGALADQVGL